MARNKTIETLSVAELRQLLIEKQRNQRHKRLAHYRKTGRVIAVESVQAVSPIDLQVTAADAQPLLDDKPPLPRRQSWLRTAADRLLFLVETAAVVGLLYVIFNGVTMMQNLNREVAAALEQPVFTATPIISEVVLPSGHIPPQNGVTRFNEEEIPSHLRPMVQSVNASQLIVTPSPQHAVNIKIESLNLFAPVVQGDGWEQLKKGVGQHIGSANPGEAGNLVVSAHNDVFGQLFKDLDRLKPGDEVTLYTQQKSYLYVVRETKIVEPTQVEVMAPTREGILTMISCYPYLIDTQRIVVIADLVREN